MPAQEKKLPIFVFMHLFQQRVGCFYHELLYFPFVVVKNISTLLISSRTKENNMKKILPVAALCSLFFIGCGGAQEPAAEAPAEGGAASELVSGYDLAKGKEIYMADCASCHDEGSLNSPKTGDAAGWTARIEQGMETLIQKSIDGYNDVGYMPPKGGNDALTDEEVADAVAYMVNESVAK